MKWQKSSSRRAIVIVMLFCLVIGGFAGYSLLGCSKPATDEKGIIEVRRGSLARSISIQGNLSTPREVKLMFDTTGTVKEIKVSKGDRVNKGQLLAKLDTTSLELAIEAAEINHKLAEETLMSTIYPQYTNTYGTDLPGVWIVLEEIEDYLKAARTLLGAGKLEEAQAQLQQAQSKVDIARDKVKGRPIALPLSVKLKELEVDKARVALDSAKLELKKAIITAPFDGIVADVGVKEGDKLSPWNYASTTVIHLIDPVIVEMTGTIDEMDIPKVKVGQEAAITVDALPHKELKGILTFISPAATVKAGVVSYNITLILESPVASEVRQGMSAAAKIITEQRHNVLLVPNRAIKGRSQNPYVEVVTGEQAEPRQITIGLSDGVHTEVLSGLKEGERVVVKVSRSPSLGFPQ